MALARIFSRYPEQTTALSQQLQQQGYRVEVLRPDEAPTTLADLEIQLEVCDPADVLRRAAELASQLQADIAVAPGALVALPQAAVAERAAPTFVAVAPGFSAPTTEPAVQPEAMDAEGYNGFPARAWRPQRLARAARASGAALAGFAAGGRELLASARAAFRERFEQFRVLAAGASERRQERLLELARRQAEARQHAVALENSRRALAGYLQQLRRDYPDTVRGAAIKPVPSATQPPVRAWTTRIRDIHLTRWEAILAGLVSATALFMAGLAVASFHSRPALSAGRGGVTLQSGGVTLPGTQAKPAAPARPSPTVRKITVKPLKPVTRARRAKRKTPQRDQDVVARDVVVRHFAAAKPAPTTQNSGWKHFSDTSN